MSTIDNSKSMFFPNAKGPETRESNKVNPTTLKRNSDSRKNELDVYAKSDAKVDIPDAIKDFSRIKKVADAAPPIDNSEKIARLKAQIQAGSYDIDYDQLADKILSEEF